MYRSAKPGQDTAHAFKVNVSNHGTETQAEAEKLQCLNPNFLEYRTTLFPARRTYGVELEVEDVQIVKSKRNGVTNYAVDVTVRVSGPPQGVIAWSAAFKRKAHSNFATYTEMERTV